jgi:hypothetical protein
LTFATVVATSRIAPVPSRPFSSAWTLVSVVLFLAVELVIGQWLAPMISGAYLSPMWHMQVQMIMHLVSFYLGGVLVGLLSPGIRLREPAIGAFISVMVVFMMSFFMPNMFMRFELTKVIVGGGLAFALALMGAYSGEKFMGNVEANDPAARSSSRGRLRSSLWADDGIFFTRDRSKL